MSFIPNSFQIANALVDDGMLAKMKGSALALYIIIVRKTRGWNKEMDSISLSQFQKFSGYGKDAVLAGLDRLIELGLIIKATDGQKTSKYMLNDLSEKTTSEEPSLSEKPTSLVGKTDKILSEKPTHNNNIKTTNTKTKGYSDKFEKFWSVYPTCKRKSDKSGTAKTFAKYESSFDLDLLISVLEKQKQDASWIKQDGEYIPSPSAWLNQKQWENDFWVVRSSSPPEKQDTPASGFTFQLPTKPKGFLGDNQ